MQKIIRKIFSAPSIKLNSLVVIEIVMLLVVSLGALFLYTRKALVEESKMDAEQRLEGTVQNVDNILMSIEQSAGNIYYRLLEHLDHPDQMASLCRHLIESNPNIDGAAIAFKPNYYPDRELFITYIHRKKYNSPELISSNSPGNYPYTKQEWYTETMRTCRPAWINPGQNKEYNLEPVVTFCLPIRDHSRECVGVIAVGLSVDLLSQIVLETKPSPHSYSVLLANDGTYIIHPNHEKLAGKNVLTEPDVTDAPSAVEAAKAMLKGDTGDMSFHMNGYNWYLFYKPFVRNSLPGRSMEELKWHIATIYPFEDIFGEYYHLVLHVLGIVVIALFVFYLLCRTAIRKQLKPLMYLTESAERIADGHYDENIPNVNRDDEVGVFYKHFQIMQKELEKNIATQEERKTVQNQRHEELEKHYRQIMDEDQMKTTFLHSVTNRMIAPSKAILDSVITLCDNYQNMTSEEADKETAIIKQQSDVIMKQLVKISYNETGKEDNHE